MLTMKQKLHARIMRVRLSNGSTATVREILDRMTDEELLEQAERHHAARVELIRKKNPSYEAENLVVEVV